VQRSMEQILLRQELLPVIREISGDCFAFRQHYAPAHHARETDEMPRNETSEFIFPALWPPTAKTSVLQ